MMRYNFRPNLTDHSQILIFVRPFFTTSDSDYHYIMDKLSSYSYATIQDCNRTIYLKFTKGYSRESMEWGKIQLHRRPLGFIGIARLSADPIQQPKDYEKIEQRFSNLIGQYDNILFDSRCIIIGPENPSIKSFRKNMFYLSDNLNHSPKEFVNYISDFISSIFVVLESKRVDKIGENFDRMVLPTAPTEREQTISESDTRNMKRKCLGRNKKLLGDFCLLSGLYDDAITHYTNAAEHLRNLNDFLWIGCALEGICAAWNSKTLRQTKPDTLSFVIDNTKIHVNVNSEEAAEEKTQLYNFTIDDIISKYSECLSCLKQLLSGPIELEAHFKFIRVLLSLKKTIEISQIIQSLLVLPLSFNDNEKIEFTCMISSIYEQLGLQRKSAFFRRRTALYYINSAQTQSKLSKAMILLHQISPAYRLSMNPADEKGCLPGWPSVQLRVLLDMLHICRQLGNKLDCVRLLCFILEKYATQLNKQEYGEMVSLMEEFSDDTEPLLNEENKQTDIQLIKPLPIVRNFQPKRLAHHLQPFKSDVTEVTGPFIFSSLVNRSKLKEEDIIWVCGDVSEVAMVVDNPLPAEIKVNNMTLLTDGITFEAHPATLALPAQSGSFPFMLLGTPMQPGDLIIKGYKVEVLGISNIVLLDKPIVVEVTPPLPIIKLDSTLPRAQSASSLDPEDQHYQTLFTSANLYRGHSCTGKITLTNAGRVPVTKLNIKMKKLRENNVVFDESSVQSQLPIEPGDTLHVDVTIMPEHSWKMFNNQDKIESTLIMTYSCDDHGDGYSRKISWVTYIKVMPSLEFSNYEITEIERHAACSMIRFDAVNMTSVSMDVTSEVKIDNEDYNISDVFNCLQKNHMKLPSKEKIRCEIHFPRLMLPKPQNRRHTMESVYQKFISESVTFNWRLSDTNYSGITYFHKLEVTTDMISVLKPRHLSISVCVNDQIVKEGWNVNTEECRMLELHIVLTNAHERALENMALHINPYQKCYRTVEQMKELCMPSGTLTKGIKKLAPGETYDHNCGLVFLYNGAYMVDVSCSTEQKLGYHLSNDQRKFEDSSVDYAKSLPVPTSPRTVTKKLKANESDFWAQSFCVTVQ